MITKPEGIVRQKMSYEEYISLPEENRILEWVNGEVIAYMPPTTRHQYIVSFLNNLLGLFVTYFQLGDLLISPFEVKLWQDGPSREPDILFISTSQNATLDDKRFVGAPALVIEIISTSSVTQDRVRKFGEYEQAGVQEYWIIDPRPRYQTIECYVLDEEGIYQPKPIDDDGIYHSSVLSNFWLQIDWLWELPKPQWAFAAIMITIESLPKEIKDAYQVLYETSKG